MNDAVDLRRQLQAAGATAQDLRAVDEVIRNLRALSGDPSASIAGLQSLSIAALEAMKKFEFDLRKRIDTSSDSLYLSGNDEAPAKYQPLVEEYFRELSKRSGQVSSQGAR
jgi:hypothetical protein